MPASGVADSLVELDANTGTKWFGTHQIWLLVLEVCVHMIYMVSDDRFCLGKMFRHMSALTGPDPG